MSKREKLLIFAVILLLFFTFHTVIKFPFAISPWLLTIIVLFAFLWILQSKSIQIILLGLGILMCAVWPLWLGQESIAEQMGNMAYFLILVGVFGEIKGIWRSYEK